MHVHHRLFRIPLNGILLLLFHGLFLWPGPARAIIFCRDASMGSQWKRNCYHGAELQYRAQIVLGWIPWRASLMYKPCETPDTTSCTACPGRLQCRSLFTVLSRVLAHPRLPRALHIILLPILTNIIFPPLVLLFVLLLPGAARARGAKGWKQFSRAGGKVLGVPSSLVPQRGREICRSFAAPTRYHS